MKTDVVQTPMSVNELFCPPEGAMQWKLRTNHPSGKEVVWVSYRDWVNGLNVRLPGCMCRKFFSVLNPDPDAINRAAELGFNPRKPMKFYTCRCSGEPCE